MMMELLHQKVNQQKVEGEEMTSLKGVETEHLRLIPFSLEMKRAVMSDRERLPQMMEATVPDDWPGPDLREAMPFFIRRTEQDPHGEVWDGIIVHKEDRTVIGDMGFKGGPDENGMVEIGYSIVHAYRRHGYASEMASRMVEWAFQQPGINTVTAECLIDNVGSIKVLENVGMRRVGVEGELVKWEISRSA
jgi:ribosomal-protein-alanine N-acetyltransferase